MPKKITYRGFDLFKAEVEASQNFSFLMKSGVKKFENFKVEE